MVSDRLGHRYPRKFGGGADCGGTNDEILIHQGNEDIVVDTWVELRRGAGELRIQILIHKPRIVLDWCNQLAAPENNREKLKPTSFVANSFLPFRPASFPPMMQSPRALGGSDSPYHFLECVTIYLDGKLTTTDVAASVVNSGTGTNANQGGQSSSLGSTNKGPMSWPELKQSSQVIVSTPPGQIPLDEIMSESIIVV